MNVGRVLLETCRNLWLLAPDYLDKWLGILEERARGERPSREQKAEAIQEAREARGFGPRSLRRAEYTVDRGVAVVPISGAIARYAPQIDDWSIDSGTSVEEIRDSFKRAIDDPAVHTVLLDIDSPGGTAAGIEELGAEIEAARTKKAIHAHIGDLGASAAYWLASKAHRITAGRTASVGSIGVYAVVMDSAEFFKARGLKPRVVRSTPLKGALYPGQEVTDEAVAPVQEEVDGLHAIFRTAVKKGRDLTQEQADMVATGRTWLGSEAKRLGLVDDLASYDQALKRLQRAGGVIPESRVAAGAEPRGGRADQDRTGGEVPTGSDATERSREMTETKTETKVVDVAAATVDDIKVANPGAASALIEEGRRAERERVATIRKRGAESQEKLVDELIETGASVEDATERFLADLKTRNAARLQEIADNGRTAGVTASTHDVDADDGKTDVAGLEPEAAAAKLWKEHPKLRELYRGQQASFAAYYKASPEKAVQDATGRSVI